MDITITIINAFISLLSLFLLTKLMGKKQISQLTLFDYTVGISIGSIASDMAVNTESPIYIPLIAMAIYAASATLISIITNHSLKLRHVINGVPLVLIENGKIIKKNMQRARIDISELLCECRVSGFFDINDIEFAVMETNGRLSFISKPDKRPAQPSDFSIMPKKDGVLANVIIDGKIMYENLKNAGFDETWLKKELKAIKAADIENIILAVCDSQGKLTAFDNSQKPHRRNVFE